MNDLSDRLYLSTVAADAAACAGQYGLGLEIAEFCTAFNMDTDADQWIAQVRAQMQGLHRFLFHAPFNELCPAAVDPLIVDVAKKRYAQAYALMHSLGVSAMVVHSGFLPILYDESWFVSHSVDFWRAFLADKPQGFSLFLENVFEPKPELLIEIVRRVEDPRFRLCFDTGHAALAGAALPIGIWIERLAPYLGHAHLHNNDGIRDTHGALGDGGIDMAALLRRIEGSAQGVSYTIESVSADPSVAWLQKAGFMATDQT